MGPNPRGSVENKLRCNAHVFLRSRCKHYNQRTSVERGGGSNRTRAQEENDRNHKVKFEKQKVHVIRNLKFFNESSSLFATVITEAIEKVKKKMKSLKSRRTNKINRDIWIYTTMWYKWRSPNKSYTTLKYI